MEKGIVYILCTVGVLLAIVVSDKALTQEIDNRVQPKIVYVKTPVVVTPTTIPTATPAAALRTVVAPTKAVVR
jgi:hypothetical protein